MLFFFLLVVLFGKKFELRLGKLLVFVLAARSCKISGAGLGEPGGCWKAAVRLGALSCCWSWCLGRCWDVGTKLCSAQSASLMICPCRGTSHLASPLLHCGLSLLVVGLLFCFVEEQKECGFCSALEAYLLICTVLVSA